MDSAPLAGSPQEDQNSLGVTTDKRHEIDRHKDMDCHAYFGFESTKDVSSVAITIRNYARNVTTTAMLDIYYDSHDLMLAHHNLWLRLRDGSWQLALVTDNPSTIPSFPVEHVQGAECIIESIKRPCPTIDWVECETNNLTLEKTFTRRLATLPTLRTTYQLNDSNAIARIDSFKSNGQFWTIGCIRTTSSEEAQQWLTKFGIKDKSPRHALVKLFTSLLNESVYDNCDLRKLLSGYLHGNVKEYASSSFSGLVDSNYPYDKFDEACTIAIQAQTPLELAFRHALALDDLV